MRPRPTIVTADDTRTIYRVVAPDDILGYYRLIEKIGAGGMGEVWKAEDTRLGRIVAVKILPPAVASDQEAIARMRREARTAAQINSPQIATIYSFEEIGERLFIVMEFVDGEPLTNVVGRGPVPEAEICRIGREVAEALAEAHAKGIIHRDIKPDNIMVSGRRVKVLDFGIAKQVSPSISPGDPTAAVLTQAGMIIGTVNYMSPEQALGKTLDARTDIFSLGIVLYQAATGKLPFKGDTATETITKIVRDEPAEPTSVNRALSPGLAKIITRCLSKQREQRWGSAADLVSALDAQMGKAATAPVTAAAPTVIDRSPAPPPRQKKKSYAGVAIAVVLVAAAVAVAALMMRAKQEPPKKTEAVPATKLNVPPPSTATVEAVAPVVAVVKATTATTTTAEAAVATQKQRKPEAAAAPQKPSADQLYSQGLTDLVEGRPGKARQQFVAAIDADPQYAKAHFRIGQIALANHNTDGARVEFKAAIDGEDRLDERERKLAHLGLAITNRNWPHARELAQEINAEHPGDPDLAAFRRDIVSEQQEQQQFRGAQRPFRGRRPH